MDHPRARAAHLHCPRKGQTKKIGTCVTPAASAVRRRVIAANSRPHPCTRPRRLSNLAWPEYFSGEINPWGAQTFKTGPKATSKNALAALPPWPNGAKKKTPANVKDGERCTDRSPLKRNPRQLFTSNRDLETGLDRGSLGHGARFAERPGTKSACKTGFPRCDRTTTQNVGWKLLTSPKSNDRGITH